MEPLRWAPPNWANLALQEHKSHHLFSLWTIKHFIVWFLGENEVISVVFQSVSRSICSIFFHFFLSFSSLFSFLNTENHSFLFSIYIKNIFLYFLLYFLLLCKFFQILFYFHYFILFYFSVFIFSNFRRISFFFLFFSLMYQAPFNTQKKNTPKI